MSVSTMALTAANIKTFTDDTANAVADLNTTVSEIQSKFNAMLETSTGHNHADGNSRSVSVGYNNITFEEYVQLKILGGIV
ncbi:hypothetical protein LCGC14_1365650 [marine sediment metagenome]|uniref:Uncharacterized protein n=1 Tax=marine sediment metagenome TaxID=412755 RepID=A0A0F9KSV7_9ZZZZ